uniref:HOIL-1/Sharpin LUBAC thetering domain-containing protein n=1 Tax=Cyanoderma ruficeps TaxID=181631 RepID=A0A8C3QMV3_9PASS
MGHAPRATPTPGSVPECHLGRDWGGDSPSLGSPSLSPLSPRGPGLSWGHPTVSPQCPHSVPTVSPGSPWSPFPPWGSLGVPWVSMGVTPLSPFPPWGPWGHPTVSPPCPQGPHSHPGGLWVPSPCPCVSPVSPGLSPGCLSVPWVSPVSPLSPMSPEELALRLAQAVALGDTAVAAQSAASLARRHAQLSVTLRDRDGPGTEIRWAGLRHCHCHHHRHFLLSSSSAFFLFAVQVFRDLGFPVAAQRWIIGQSLCRDGRSLRSYGIRGDGDAAFLFLLTARAAGLRRLRGWGTPHLRQVWAAEPSSSSSSSSCSCSFLIILILLLSHPPAASSSSSSRCCCSFLI